jgi:hypothetical protein
MVTHSDLRLARLNPRGNRSVKVPKHCDISPNQLSGLLDITSIALGLLAKVKFQKGATHFTQKLGSF